MTRLAPRGLLGQLAALILAAFVAAQLFMVTAAVRSAPSAVRLRAGALAGGGRSRADFAQLDVEDENTRRIVAVEETSRRDHGRVQELVAQGAAPPTRADEQERATLQIERSAADLAKALDLIPSRRARREAQVARTEAARARAERDLDKTRITSPFELRVGQVHVEASNSPLPARPSSRQTAWRGRR